MPRRSLMLCVPDPDAAWTAVRLCSDLHLPSRELRREDGEWVLRLPPLRTDRVEYELEVERPDGTAEVIADPGNPARAPGAFGEKSVISAPQYRPPAWLGADRVESERSTLAPGSVLRRRLRAELWAPAGRTGEQLPLLVAHDGPEYDRLARLTEWAGAMVQGGRLPPFRLALLPPGDRDRWYGAAEAYARALAERVVPALRERTRARGPVIGMGASLGALAWLHAHRRFPGLVDGLFLQSGSFFTAEHDAQESGFPPWTRIVAFVGGVHRTHAPYPHPVPVAMTCGAEEENVHNNRAMAAALAGQGYPVEFAENRDMHNYTGWRDALDPWLTNLLARLWG